jgi:hypothetical protein
MYFILSENNDKIMKINKFIRTDKQSYIEAEGQWYEVIPSQSIMEDIGLLSLYEILMFSEIKPCDPMKNEKALKVDHNEELYNFVNIILNSLKASDIKGQTFKITMYNALQNLLGIGLIIGYERGFDINLMTERMKFIQRAISNVASKQKENDIQGPSHKPNGVIIT